MLHFLMVNGLDIELPVVLGPGGLADLDRSELSDEYLTLEAKGCRVALRADDIVCFYSEGKTGTVTVRHRGNEKRTRVERDRTGAIAGMVTD